MLSRRGFLGGIAATALARPAVIRTPGLLMPVSVRATSRVTAEAILSDINAMLDKMWEASGWALVPDRLLVSPRQFAYLQNAMVGKVSLLEHVQLNSLCYSANGRMLDIRPFLEWVDDSADAGVRAELPSISRHE